MPPLAKHPFHRNESRILIELPVWIEGSKVAPGSESTFTENVSANGARVVSVRRWRIGDQITFASRSGEFRSPARVAYCQSMAGHGFAIGVEFLEPKGRWVVQSQKKLDLNWQADRGETPGTKENR
jgi:hypothetical protein